MAVVDLVPSWTDRLNARLYDQFRDDPSWQAWCAMLGKQFDDLEAAGQSLLNILSIDHSSGAVLDLIGRIVGQPRGGVSDATYRLYLKARIRVNRSSGTAEDLYAVLVLLGMGSANGVPLNVQTFGPAAVLVTAWGISIDPFLVAQQFLADAKLAGVNLAFEWSTVPLASALVLGDIYAPGFTAGPAPANGGVTAAQCPGDIYHASFAAGPPPTNAGGGLLGEVTQV